MEPGSSRRAMVGYNFPWGWTEAPHIPPTIIFLPWHWSFGMKRSTKTTLNTYWAVVEPSKTQWKEHGLKGSEQQEIGLVRKDQRNSRSSFNFGSKHFSKASLELPEMRRRGVKPGRGMAPQHFASCCPDAGVSATVVLTTFLSSILPL